MELLQRVELSQIKYENKKSPVSTNFNLILQAKLISSHKVWTIKEFDFVEILQTYEQYSFGLIHLLLFFVSQKLALFACIVYSKHRVYSTKTSYDWNLFLCIEVVPLL